MGTALTDNAKIQLAKSFTELAIQNNLIDRYEDTSRTAKEVACFFDTIFNTLGKTDNEG